MQKLYNKYAGEGQELNEEKMKEMFEKENVEEREERVNEKNNNNRPYRNYVEQRVPVKTAPKLQQLATL